METMRLPGQPLQRSRSQSDAACVDTLLSYTAYRHSSSAGWIVFVPGAGATTAIWGRQLRTFRHHWNVLAVNLRGHGKSPKPAENVPYTFQSTAADILEVMDHEAIHEAHFVALSLGCLLVEMIASTHPERVKSMVLAGGIARLDSWALLFMRFGSLTKRFLPYMLLYRLFAWVIMPGPRHRRTRKLFHSQARRLSEAEFLRWYHLTKDVRAVIQTNATRENPVPTLYVMGESDYMFRRHAQRRAHDRDDTSIEVLRGAGHVCSMEQPEAFNCVTLAFIKHCECAPNTQCVEKVVGIR